MEAVLQFRPERVSQMLSDPDATRRNLLFAGAVRSAAAGGLGHDYPVMRSPPRPEPRQEPSAAQGPRPTEVSVEELMKPGPLPELSVGKADAPITIVEYASMTCGHCASFHNTVFPALKEKYIDTGKARHLARVPAR